MSHDLHSNPEQVGSAFASSQLLYYKDNLTESEGYLTLFKNIFKLDPFQSNIR